MIGLKALSCAYKQHLEQWYQSCSSACHGEECLMFSPVTSYPIERSRPRDALPMWGNAVNTVANGMCASSDTQGIVGSGSHRSALSAWSTCLLLSFDWVHRWLPWCSRLLWMSAGAWRTTGPRKCIVGETTVVVQRGFGSATVSLVRTKHGGTAPHYDLALAAFFIARLTWVGDLGVDLGWTCWRS